ncbi:hypothetical protein Hanom_Chr06g00511021 [Helianthus anomalus]
MEGGDVNQKVEMEGHQQWRVRGRVPPHNSKTTIQDVTSNGRVGVRVLSPREFGSGALPEQRLGVAGQ